MVLVPVVAVGFGLLVDLARHDQPPAGSTVIDLESEAPPIEAPEQTSVMESAPPDFDVRTALRDIGERTLKAHPIAAPSATWIAADGACVRPTAAERKQLTARVATWLDQKYSDETSDGFDIRFGCTDPTGIVVEGNGDRTDTHRMARNRGWILQINDDAVTALDERTSTTKNNWMEWADEGTLAVLALIDHTVIWTNTEHEGGSIESHYVVKARGRATPVARISGILDARLIDRALVLSIGAHADQRVGYRCISPDLELRRCPAAITAEAIEIATDYVYGTEVSDRELVADQLAKLHVSKAEAMPIVDAMPEAPAAERAQRHLAAFLAHVQIDGDLDTELSPHVAAATYFHELSSKLGDAACAPSPQFDKPALEQWAAAQRTKGHRAVRDIAISQECAGYAWVAWDDWKYDDNATRHEALVMVGDEIERIVELTAPSNGDPQSGPSSSRVATFYQQGDTVVGLVIHTSDSGTNELLAIANGHVVGTRHGEFA
ncbi:MAG TPA: hypothetical protein VF403_09785, partial [Kofleriaceae bacterium]